MAIINRLARLFKADLHAVLDHIEEPELQLKQAIREMDEQLQANNAHVQKLKAQLEMFSKRKSVSEGLLNKTNNEIVVCFENNNDNLAKGLIRRKLETNSVIESLKFELESTEQQIQALQKESDEFASTINGMQQKAALMTNHKTSSKVQSDLFVNVNDSDVEVAFLEEKQCFVNQAKNA